MFSLKLTFSSAFVCLACLVGALKDHKDGPIGLESFGRLPLSVEFHSDELGQYREKKEKSDFGYYHRLLLQQYSCRWIAADGRCILSADALLSLLGASSSPTAQMIVDREMCSSATTAFGCNGNSFCLWDGQRCFFFDYSIGNSQSPCVQHAPATIDFYAAALECPLETTMTSCTSIDGCSWGEESGTCFEDFSGIFFGLDDTSGMTDEDLLGLVDADGDRDFIETLIDCLGRTSESACTGTCSWSTASGRCTVGFAAVIHAITVNSGGSTDPVCSYFSMLEDSGCYVTSSSAECAANDNCIYNNGCSWSINFLLQRTADEDPGFGDAFSSAHASCARFTTAQTCS